jgi:hypothetical protein
MSTEILWDKSLMEWKPVEMTITIHADADDAMVSNIIERR